MPNLYCDRTSQIPQFTQISAPTTPMSTGILQTELFSVDSLVLMSAMPAHALDYQDQSQGSGLKCSESLPQLNPDLSLWKILQGLSIEDFEQCLEDSEWRDIQQKLKLSRRRRLALRTKENGFLSLPTLTAGVKKKGSRPPGQVKLEVKLRQLALIPNSQQLSGEMMALFMGFPPDWTQCLSPSPQAHWEESKAAISTDAQLYPPVQMLPSIGLSFCKSGGEMANASKESDKWYTPLNIEDLVTQVLGAIDLDPCADDGKHIAAAHHYTASDDGLSLEWHGRVFMNPPYSCPGKWIAKLEAEYKSGRVTEAIALVPAATDTNWLSPLLASQPVCFWKGRIKFLDTSYQPKQSARQSHCLIYWGENWQRFKEVFDPFGVAKMPEGRWNPDDFGHLPCMADGDQLTIFYDDTHEPPDCDDYPNIPAYEQAWGEWEQSLGVGDEGVVNNQCPMPNTQCPMPNAQCPMPDDSQPKDKTMTFQFSGTQAIAEQIAQLQEQLNQLTATLKPYQECEQKAEEMRREVANYGREMISKTIPQEDIFNWAKSLYSAASGVEFVEGDIGVIAAQNEVIAELKTELAGVNKRQEQAQEDLKKFSTTSVEVATKLKFCEQERDQLKLELENFSAQTDTATVALRKENLSLITKIQKLENFKKQPMKVLPLNEDDTISEQIIDILKDQNELSGNQIIESLGMDDEAGRGVYTVLNRLLAKNTISAIQDPLDKRKNLYRLYSANNTQHDTQHSANNTQHDTQHSANNTQHDTQHSANNTQHDTPRNSASIIAAQIKGREFIASVKTKVGINNITWTTISEVCQSNPIILREIIHSASTKLQKDFTNIDNLAKLMSEYILETGDITDFNWLDKTFIAKVEALVEVKKSLPYHKDDCVRAVDTGLIWQVRSFDGEWLSVIANSKITSLHKSEVELMHQEVAA
jgi:phage N-6-adenine-methyltransferase